MKPFGIFSISLIALSIIASSHSCDAKTTHSEKNGQVSVITDHSWGSYTFSCESAVVVDYAFIEELKPLVAVLKVRVESVSDFRVELAHKARDRCLWCL